MSRLPFLVALTAIIASTFFRIFLRPEFYVHTSDGIVIITGTSSGIGRKTCEYLSERHPQITFYCGVRKQEDGYQFSTLKNVVPVILDVTKDEDVNYVVSKVKESGKPLVAVFNNAGVSKLKTVEFQELEEVKWHFDVHLFGTLRLTQAALPLLRQFQGRVLIMSSVMGRFSAAARLSAYAGAKHALEAFGDALRKETQDLGVSVSLIEPGFLKSKITANSKKQEREDHLANGEEMRIYPHIYNKEKMIGGLSFLSYLGSMEETCQAIEDAMFGKYPKTRYVTSVVGLLPSWICLHLTDILPDRVTDYLLQNTQHMSTILGFLGLISGVKEE